MKEINYQDYIEYKKLKLKQINRMLQLREPEVEYNVHQPHDKILKTVLEDKSQVIELLKRMLKVNLKETEIEKYKNKYINYMFKNSESDIVYKMIEKEIYFLIEHQSKIDYSMPKRILEYEIAIMQSAIKGKNMTKTNHKLPRVISIVIYTGDKKWDVEKYIEECQEILKEPGIAKFGEYYVLDVNDYTNEELENDTLFLSTILRLEKAKTEEEIFTTIEKAIQKEKEEENRMILKRIILYMLK